MNPSRSGARPGLRRAMVALAATAVATTSLAACSSDTDNGPSDGSCPTATSELKLAFVYASTTQNPFQEMAMGAQAAADADGNVDLQLSAPTGIDGPKEVALFQAATRTATDGVAYMTVTPDLFVRPLNDATDSGLPVIAVDAAPPPGVEGVKTTVANSNTELGEQLAEAFLTENPQPDGEIVLGNDIPSLPLLVQRLDGVQSVLADKLPDATIVGPLDSKSEPTENYNAWKAIVQAHPDAIAFIGVGGQDGVSLPLIQKQTGTSFLAGSADLPPEALQAVKDGQLFALSSPEHWMKGYIALHLLIEAKRTCESVPEGWWNSGSLLVDMSNIDDILARQQTPESRTAWFQDEIDRQLSNPPLAPMSQAN